MHFFRGGNSFFFSEFFETEAIRSLPWLPRHGRHGLVGPGKVGPPFHSFEESRNPSPCPKSRLEVAGTTERYTDIIAIIRINQIQIKQTKSICSLDMLGLFEQIGASYVATSATCTMIMPACFC